ncbi:DUF2497 domain-containing protein [Microvirga sp. HBU67558]|uniref:DUF2497 domain-containing protein n=1 Tax=Microvirga TaxID=186650 RepID=UPI001B366FB8|nr:MULTISPECIES: DUF2497 domain-containing protein [unclassified Microvirga]MBQ0824332.1 DUF2497 domain-containing protein [Microvirga sp. HBU67558]
MEEILASIRRIISDDEALQSPEPEQPASSPLKNVLDIAEMHMSPLIAPGPNESVLGPWSRGEAMLDERPTDEGSEHFHDGREPRQPTLALAQIAASEAATRAAAPITLPQPATADLLLSKEASAAVSGAFDRLSVSVKPSQPQTVEDLMKEMLRPMLKAWLDDNLPSMVERLVRGEIERVTRSRS